MASDGRNTAVAAFNAAISSADHRYTPPEERRWKVYWAKYWCFKSQKKEKRIVPAARSEGGSGSARGWPAAQAGLVPPSSPASFVNSTVQSPASFTLSLSAVSASMCSPGRPNTMFTIGPYAHETQLVSPPVFSTFSTEPSTAPFTPPPELAHLTTPSSPDVPFAYIASSYEGKRSVRETISPLSTSTLASPCDTPVSYTRTSSQYYLGSPVGRLVSPTLGYSSGEVTSYENHPMHLNASVGQTVSSFPTFDPFASRSFDGVPFAAFILPCDASSKCEDPSSITLVQHDLNHKYGKSSTCEKGGGIFLERKVEADLRHEGNDLVSMSLETCNRDWRNTDECALQSDGASSVISASGDHACIKKGEKLHKLFAHERNEMVFSQHAENSDGTCTAYNEDGCFEPSARKGGQANEGESTPKIEAATTEVLGQSSAASVDLLQEVDMRPVIFELDEFS